MNEPDNPFRPPTPTRTPTPTPAPAPPRLVPAPRPGSPVLAVTLGVVADIGGTFVVGFVLAVAAAVVLGVRGVPPEEVATILSSPNPYSWFSIFSYLLGSSLSILGGYVCARIARRDEYKLAGIVAALVVVFGIFFSTPGRLPIPMHAFLVLLTVASVMLGAWRGAIRNERDARAALRR